MIYCVWYPSGGFGYFVNAVLSLYGHNFVRPHNQLTFSTNGNSHQLDLVVPRYYQQQWTGRFDFDPDKNYSVLIDNGINDEGDQFRDCFPSAEILKICYTDHTWPIVAHTMIKKALESTLKQEIAPDFASWQSQDDWVLREKYFLFLRDHALRSHWRPNNFSTPLYIDSIIDYDDFYKRLTMCGINVDSFEPVWESWRQANAKYIDPVTQCQQIMHNVSCGVSQQLTDVTDIWTQAVLYYYIWIEHGVEVPHNDFAEFFYNTDQIRGLVT